MTVGDLLKLCGEKIAQENPLRLPDPPQLESLDDIEEVGRGITEHFGKKMDYGVMLADAIEEVLSALYEELGIAGGSELGNVPRDTPLPPRTKELAEKFALFPSEMTEIDIQ